MIYYGRHSINETDVAAVLEVLNSDYLTQGPAVEQFEGAVLKYCNAGYAVAVNSATSALHLACLSLGVGAGDKVWTSAVTFVSSSNSALYCGADVDFVDINHETFNMDVEILENKLEKAEKEGCLPKVVMPVHLAGQPCDMASIARLAKKYNFFVIEDASHALGAKYQNEPIGACIHSDITVFSFHPVKIITSGEGGMALTNNPILASKMRKLRTHGITSDPSEMEERPVEELWNYQQIELGYNYRLPDILAALGVSQMQRLDQFLEKRRVIATIYDEELVGLPIITPTRMADSISSNHLYIIRFETEKISRSHKTLFKELHSRGITGNLHYIPVPLQPFYRKLGFLRGSFPAAERYFNQVMSIPIYPGLTANMQKKCIDEIKGLL